MVGINQAVLHLVLVNSFNNDSADQTCWDTKFKLGQSLTEMQISLNIDSRIEL